MQVGTISAVMAYGLHENVMHLSHWIEFRAQLDGIISAVVGSIAAIGIVTGSVFLFQSAWAGPGWQRSLAALFFLWCLITEFWFLFGTWRAIGNGEEPWAVVVAVQQPRLWPLLRPVASLWWVYHFSLALVWGILLSVAGQIPLAVKPLVVLVVTALSYLTFVYVLLAATAFTRNTNVIGRVWNWRGRWALVHGALVLLAEVVALLV
jgi:hypothetical protein